jgi:hypothetical protein
MGVTKVRITRIANADVIRRGKVRPARSGKGDTDVIQEARRRELGADLIERLWARNDLSEDEATALALEAQHALRARMRSATAEGPGRQRSDEE